MCTAERFIITDYKLLFGTTHLELERTIIIKLKECFIVLKKQFDVFILVHILNSPVHTYIFPEETSNVGTSKSKKIFSHSVHMYSDPVLENQRHILKGLVSKCN